MRPLKLLYTSSNLVYALLWRRPGRPHMHSPHVGLLSPIEVTVCSMGPDSHTTGPPDRTDLCMYEASWTPLCTVHLKFENI